MLVWSSQHVLNQTASSSFSKQLLKGVISDTALPLGTTDNGKVWATKALHPSDTEVPGGGVPDHKTLPSAIIHFNSRYKISAPATATETGWSMDALIGADPCCFGRVFRGIPTSTEPLINAYTCGVDVSDPADFLINPELAGSMDALPHISYWNKSSNWKSNVQMYRLNYLGCTLNYDAPAVSNQGFVVATQYPYSEKKFSYAYMSQAVRDTNVWPLGSFPTFGQLQNMPGVYSGKASEGCYVPLKLNESDFSWKLSANRTLEHSDVRSGPGAPAADCEDWINLDNVNSSCYHPLCPVRDTMWNAGTPAIVDLMNPRGSENVAHISLRGLNTSGNVYLTIRAGYEVVVKPGSVYAPLVVRPVPYDPVALDAYFSISRLLADAYPESYNSMGTILNTIGSVASVVLPKLLPILGSGVKQLMNCWGPKEESLADKAAAVDSPEGESIERNRQKAKSVAVSNSSLLALRKRMMKGRK